jgi:hypothetical protein
MLGLLQGNTSDDRDNSEEIDMPQDQLCQLQCNSLQSDDEQRPPSKRMRTEKNARRSIPRSEQLTSSTSPLPSLAEVDDNIGPVTSSAQSPPHSHELSPPPPNQLQLRDRAIECDISVPSTQLPPASCNQDLCIQVKSTTTRSPLSGGNSNAFRWDGVAENPLTFSSQSQPSITASSCGSLNETGTPIKPSTATHGLLTDYT